MLELAGSYQDIQVHFLMVECREILGQPVWGLGLARSSTWSTSVGTGTSLVKCLVYLSRDWD